MSTPELAQEAFLPRRIHRGNAWVNDSANRYCGGLLNTVAIDSSEAKWYLSSLSYPQQSPYTPLYPVRFTNHFRFQQTTDKAWEPPARRGASVRRYSRGYVSGIARVTSR